MKFLTKLLFVMKLTAVVLLATVLQVSAKTATSQTVSYSAKNEKLEKIFNVIKEQTGYVFFYKLPDLQGTKPVTVNLKNEPLTAALQKILKDQSLAFSIEGNTVFITVPQTKASLSQGLNPVLYATPPEIATIDVHGVVKDESDKAAAGVSIAIKGGKTVGVTNDKGEFTLTGMDKNTVLVFSAVSIETFEVKLNGKNELTLRAKTKVSVLDEVQMIAYGTTTRRLATGSVVKMKGEDIRKQPVEDPMLALGGRMPGLQITQTSGIAGGPVSVSIRGKSSLGAGSEPLYIIDGVPFAHSLTNVLLSNGVTAQILGGLTSANIGTSPFVSINSADIESIEVLKDADATAIYGSRGSNGVVLITTRKAKTSKTSVDASFYSGWGRPTRVPEFMNTQQYVAMRKEAFKNDGIVPTAANATDLMVWDTTRYTNWAKLLMGNTARSSDAQVRLSGGSQQTQFSLSTGFHREIPIFYGNMFDDRVNVRASIVHHSIDNKFSLTLNASYNIDNSNINTTDLGQLLTTIPNAPNPLDANGNLVWSENGITFSNPLQYTKKLYKGVTENAISNINLGYRFSKNFEIRVDGGMNIVRLDQKSTNPVSSQSPLFFHNNLPIYTFHASRHCLPCDQYILNL